MQRILYLQYLQAFLNALNITLPFFLIIISIFLNFFTSIIVTLCFDSSQDVKPTEHQTNST